MEGGTTDNNQDENSIVVSDSVADTDPIKPVATAIPPHGSEGSIRWTASEFVSHKKGPLWYITVIVISLVFAGVTYLLTRDVVASSVFVAAALVLVIFGAKRPRELDYRIDSEGIHIGNNSFPYDRFRSFSLVHQGAFSSMILYPIKRFSLLTTAYYDSQDEPKILALISSYLPLEEPHGDLLDQLMWKIRF